MTDCIRSLALVLQENPGTMVVRFLICKQSWKVTCATCHICQVGFSILFQNCNWLVDKNVIYIASTLCNPSKIVSKDSISYGNKSMCSRGQKKHCCSWDRPPKKNSMVVNLELFFFPEQSVPTYKQGLVFFFFFNVSFCCYRGTWCKLHLLSIYLDNCTSGPSYML